MDKTCDKVHALAGDIVTYTVTVTNDGSADSPNLIGELTDTLVDLEAFYGSAAGNDFNIPATGTNFVVFTYTYTIPTQADDHPYLRNTATATSHPDGFTNPINASDFEDLIILKPSLKFIKTGIATAPGTTATYQIEIINTNSTNTPNLMIRVNDTGIDISNTTFTSRASGANFFVPVPPVSITVTPSGDYSSFTNHSIVEAYVTGHEDVTFFLFF